MRVFVAGCGHDGRLGLGGEDNRPALTELRFFDGSTPDRAPTHVAVGGFHTFVRTESGAFFGFGLNEHGQLGLRDRASRHRPAEVPDLAPGRLAPGAHVVHLSCGAYHTAALLSDGTVWTCGRNDHGQLGHGDADDRAAFAMAASLPFPGPTDTAASMQGLVLAVAVSAGSHHTAALVVPAEAAVAALRPSNGATAGDAAMAVPYRSDGTPLIDAMADTDAPLDPALWPRAVCCGKGDFGELGFDAAAWDLVEATERRVKAGVRRRAHGEGMAGAAVGTGVPDGVPMKPRPAFMAKSKPAVVRRPEFSRPTFAYLARPPMVPQGPDADAEGQGEEATPLRLVGLRAGHHHTAVATADGAWFDFGCYYAGAIEDAAASVPRPVALPSEGGCRGHHAGDEVCFAWGPEGLWSLGRGWLGTPCDPNSDDDNAAPRTEAKTWAAVPLSPEPCVVTAVSGTTHFVATVRRAGGAVAHHVLGDNYFGQLGLGDERGRCAFTELALPAGCTEWGGAAAGSRHTVVLAR